MKKSSILLSATLLCYAAPAVAAPAACPAWNASVPPGANITAASAPFFIDTSGLDLKTAPPTRDPANPDYPRASALADGAVPSPRADGNFIIGPSHPAASETAVHPGVPRGRVLSFTMSSTDSVIYRPGMVRDDADDCLNAAIYGAHIAPGDASDVIVTSSHPGQWTRSVDVYVPAGHLPRAAPFIVFGDGGPAGFFNERQFFTTLDNLIHRHRLPPMLAIGIGAGGQDAQGSERGREYDAVSGTYAEWVEREVLPRVEHTAHVTLTRDPDARATMGISSSGAAAFTMAWFHPELYHRVLAYSPTMVNQQWPHDSALPGGAWEYHDDWAGPRHAARSVEGVHLKAADGSPGAPLIANAPHKPIRYWFETGDRDLFYPAAPLADGMHDWVLANEHMAKVLAAANYRYQFVFARDAVHVDKPTVAQTLPEALEWVWQGYKN
ncbi:alpha/beta hydrolase [Lichenicoccus sp.]|uniref:alpha/beta hydrolase n=1 Tax=Lichenicoccus sp. TaxID=2781899 RepID=UPI003D0E3EBA